MAFPETSILDDFNRTNDTTPPPGTNWSTIYNGHDIVTNRLLGHVNADANVSQWVGGTYGPSIECYITVLENGSSGSLFILDNTFDHGYSVNWSSGTINGIYRQDTAGSSEARLGTALSQTVDTGDAIGIYYNAVTDTIYAYFKDSSGSWTEIGNRSDSTYTDMDTLGIYTYAQYAFDDFGGGTVSTGGATAVPVFYHHLQEQGVS